MSAHLKSTEQQKQETRCLSKVEGRNRLVQVAHWTLHAHCGTLVRTPCPCPHTHQIKIHVKTSMFHNIGEEFGTPFSAVSIITLAFTFEGYPWFEKSFFSEKFGNVWAPTVVFTFKTFILYSSWIQRSLSPGPTSNASLIDTLWYVPSSSSLLSRKNHLLNTIEMRECLYCLGTAWDPKIRGLVNAW